MWPLRFHLVKDLRRHARRLNRVFEMHENQIVDARFADRRERPRHNPGSLAAPPTFLNRQWPLMTRSNRSLRRRGGRALASGL